MNSLCKLRLGFVRRSEPKLQHGGYVEKEHNGIENGIFGTQERLQTDGNEAFTPDTLRH
jgi:hypothetical protein